MQHNAQQEDAGKCLWRSRRGRKRPRGSKMLFRKPNVWAIVVAASLVLLDSRYSCARAQGPEPQCVPQKDTQYDWETMNYYELLGLVGTTEDSKSKKRNKKTSNVDEWKAISNKEIRKAYRKQAQRYHPDKQKKGNNNNNSTTQASLSVDESTARFAKIAEAYEFLSDDTKRQDYNSFLQYCQANGMVADDEENEGRLSTMLKKKFSGLFEDLSNVDPFKVFEDFFFGKEEDWEDHSYFDPKDPFSHLRYESETSQHQPPQEDPLRVFQEERKMYDPMTGENLYRVLQTEEFSPSTDSSFYYRIVAQDFKEHYDPYTARQIYVPITEPYLQEDGYRTVSSFHHQQQQQDYHHEADTNLRSILHPWEVLTPSSKLLVSPNGKYVAGLTQDCELLVMINHEKNKEIFREDFVLWSTQRPYGSNGYAANHCFALLKGPHLVVTVGKHPHSSASRILWHSDATADEDDSQHGYYDFEDDFGFWHKRQRSYLAQLDNDGGLSVYTIWNEPKDDQSRTEPLFSRALESAHNLWHGRIHARDEYGHLYSTSSSMTFKRCIYSTTALPFGGCWRFGRKLREVSLEWYFQLHKLWSKMNHLADTWLDLIYEEDDIFYELKESIWRNTNAFGSKMLGSSARLVRKLLEGFHELSRSVHSFTEKS